LMGRALILAPESIKKVTGTVLMTVSTWGVATLPISGKEVYFMGIVAMVPGIMGRAGSTSVKLRWRLEAIRRAARRAEPTKLTSLRAPKMV